MRKNFFVSCTIGAAIGLLFGVLPAALGKMVVGWPIIGTLVGVVIAGAVGRFVEEILEEDDSTTTHFVSANVCSLIGGFTGLLTAFVCCAASFTVAVTREEPVERFDLFLTIFLSAIGGGVGIGIGAFVAAATRALCGSGNKSDQ